MAQHGVPEAAAKPLVFKCSETRVPPVMRRVLLQKGTIWACESVSGGVSALGKLLDLAWRHAWRHATPPERESVRAAVGLGRWVG